MELDPELLSDELPAEARILIEEAEDQLARISSVCEQTTDAIQDQAERDCTAIRAKAQKDTAAAQRAASLEVTPILRDLFGKLKTMQTQLAQSGLLDEALAIRGRLRSLRADLFNIRPDPGSMSDFSTSDYGRAYLFEVVGSNEGSIWGDQLYTADSRVNTAAVHAGALRVGERGIVRVTLYDGSEQLFPATLQHGVQSLEYNHYSLAYAVERI